MNIVIVTSDLAATGPGFVAQELANHFIILGHKVNVLALSQTDREKIKLNSSVEEYTLRIKKGSTGIQRRLTWMINKKNRSLFESYMNNIKPDVVISNGVQPDFFNSLSSSKWIKISISHNNPFENYPDQYGLIQGLGMAIFQILTMRRMDKVITLNPRIKKIHSFFLGKGKVELILNGISEVGNNSDKAEQAFFGTVGTVNKGKNQVEILRAKTQLPEASLILWGEGPEKLRLESEFISNKIYWKSFEKDKDIIFSSFKVLVSMSKTEGFPLSVVEAVSAGKPLILSDIPAHRYLTSFLPAETYRLVSTRKSLIEAMQYFIDIDNKHELASIQDKLKYAYRSYFTSIKMAKKYIDVIESVVNK